MTDEELFAQRRLARQEKARQDAALMQLHERAADALASADAQAVRDRALARINTWEKKALCSDRYIAEWRRILKLPPDLLRQAMLQADGDGIALRQNTPFSFLMSSPSGGAL